MEKFKLEDLLPSPPPSPPVPRFAVKKKYFFHMPLVDELKEAALHGKRWLPEDLRSELESKYGYLIARLAEVSSASEDPEEAKVLCEIYKLIFEKGIKLF